MADEDRYRLWRPCGPNDFDRNGIEIGGIGDPTDARCAKFRVAVRGPTVRVRFLVPDIGCLRSRPGFTYRLRSSRLTGGTSRKRSSRHDFVSRSAARKGGVP